MNVPDLFRAFRTQEQGVEYLEEVRWGGEPVCPYCGKKTVARHASGDRKLQRWQCWSCDRTFSATVGTLFHGTHMPLRDWFLVAALMLGSREPPSAYQISRDTGIRRPTVWSMMQRISAAVVGDPAQKRLLYGIIKADVAGVGGKPSKVSKLATKRAPGTRERSASVATQRLRQPSDRAQVCREQTDRIADPTTPVHGPARSASNGAA